MVIVEIYTFVLKFLKNPIFSEESDNATDNRFFLFVPIKICFYFIYVYVTRKLFFKISIYIKNLFCFHLTLH